MKKTLVILLIALIAVTSVFAATKKTTDKETQVVLNLEKDPNYVIAVTENANRAVKTSKTLTHVSQIALGYDNDDDAKPITWTTDKTYYVSYRFLETENVKIQVALSGDMLLDGKTSATAKASEKISYKLTLAKDDAAKEDSVNATPTTTEILSSDTTTHDITTLANVTEIGDVKFDNFKLNIAANTDTSVIGKELGSYAATITLSVVSAS